MGLCSFRLPAIRAGCLGVRGIRKQWSDSSKKRLDEKISDIIKGTILVAHALKNERIRRKRKTRKGRGTETARGSEKQRAAEDAKLRDLEKQAEYGQKPSSSEHSSSSRKPSGREAIPDDTKQWLKKWITWQKSTQTALIR